MKNECLSDLLYSEKTVFDHLNIRFITCTTELVKDQKNMRLTTMSLLN